MSHGNSGPSLTDTRTTLDELGPRLFRFGLILGVLGLVAAVVLGVMEGDGLRRFGFSYLVSFAFYLSISLGALFFVAINHLTRATWSVIVRRLAEVMSAALPVLGIIGIPILLLAPQIFPWAGDGGGVHPELLAHKEGYLNLPFFVVRWVIYFLLWSLMGIYYWRRSLKQDITADPGITIKMEARSGPAIVIYAFTVTVASYDLLMSLDPAWFSTMFGPYYFTGGLVGFYAFLTMVTYWLQGRGRLNGVIHKEHFHDYGKLLFAFLFFWAYLAYSQYMLYWYANIPEETAWLLQRQNNGWGWIGLVLIFGHFLLPFAGLISVYAKRKRSLLIFWAIWMFIMHWFDLYWLVMPEFSSHGPGLRLMDLAGFIGLGGLYIATLARLATGHSLVPLGDPRLKDSINFENA